jgi:hypothetical protein
MEFPALGIWVAFLKQPALPAGPGKAPQTQKNFLKKNIINTKSQINQK